MALSSSPLRVVVTAGASGIGAAIAQAFLESGAQVVIGDADAEQTERFRGASPAAGVAVVDVAEPQQVERFIEFASTRMGSIDVLVNNAGIGGPRAPVEDIAWDEWERTMRVNAGGAFNTVRATVPMFKRQKSGCILNVSTSSVRTGLPLRLPYIASKAALMGMTQNLARELGPFGIRCNAILPGSVANERGDRLLALAAERQGITPDEALERRMQYISMRERVTPQEIAAMAVFLASPAACHVSGQFIGVCGNVEWEA